MKRHAFSLALLLSCASLSAVENDGPIPEPSSYRMDAYMAPTPKTLRGAMVVGSETLKEMMMDGNLLALIDVMPLKPKPPNFPVGRLWRTPTRYNIPGSLWLPNVGYGDAPEDIEGYFIRNLKKATTEDASGRLVFYCLDSCWMSWNAAKRALALGYRNVYWFPGGTEEWEFAGYELEVGKPVKMPAVQT